MQFLARLYDWLCISDDLQPSDLIFVLAGRECRKQFGLKLLGEGWTSILLLSVGRFEIRRFMGYKLPEPSDLIALASSIPPQSRHFFVAIGETQMQTELVPWQRFGTWREIGALAKWLRKHESMRSVTLVSSAFHLRRVRWCCERLLPRGLTVKFVAVPVELPAFNRLQWWRNALSRKLVILEVAKLTFYPVLLAGPAWMRRMGGLLVRDWRPVQS